MFSSNSLNTLRKDLFPQKLDENRQFLQDLTICTIINEKNFMSKKIHQPSIKVKEEEIPFSNTVKTHTKAELNPVSMKSQWQNSQGQP